MRNPGIAAVLSFFWPGVGQIYNGQMTKGLILVAINAICWLLNITLILSIIGIPVQAVLTVYAIYDAYKTAQKLNEKEAPTNQ